MEFKKGAAISLPKGATDQQAVEAVTSRYEEKMRSLKGWNGVAVVNVGDEGAEGFRKVLVKVTSTSIEVYHLAASAPIASRPSIGTLKKA